ncbi:glycoside hydrolase superfamily [Umbelopsis sp. PMI_123]|nr:glycoside hydrolase superfamily [Umbelopsis sp. PMI_123]
MVRLAIFSVVALLVSSSVACGSSPKTHGKVSAYVVDWELPTNISYNKLDHLLYSFAIPDKTGALGQFSVSQLQSVVKNAHAHGKAVSLAIGGWTGSLYFSTLVQTASSRDAWSDVLVKAVKDYDLDGLNLDWEYPNDPNGVACNAKNAHDTANFLSFVQILRKKLQSNFKSAKLITAAVATSPFNDASGNPSTRLPGWADALDYFYIMAYDIAGTWKTDTSSNSPLYSSKYDDSSDSAAVAAWNKAGIPKNKLVLGVPFYGFTIDTEKAISAATGQNVPMNPNPIQGDQYDTKSADPCPGAVATYSGEMQWRTIKQLGILQNHNGWKSYWSSINKTPYAYKSSNKQFVTFDDPESLTLKAQYAKKQNLGGVMMWSLEMDDADHSLLNALQAVY